MVYARGQAHDKIMQYVKKVFFRAITVWIGNRDVGNRYEALYKNIDDLFEDICDKICNITEDPQFIEKWKRYDGLIEEWHYYYKTDPNFAEIPEVIELDREIDIYKEMIWQKFDQIFKNSIPCYANCCNFDDDLEITDLFYDIF